MELLITLYCWPRNSSYGHILSPSTEYVMQWSQTWMNAWVKFRSNIFELDCRAFSTKGTFIGYGYSWLWQQTFLCRVRFQCTRFTYLLFSWWLHRTGQDSRPRLLDLFVAKGTCSNEWGKCIRNSVGERAAMVYSLLKFDQILNRHKGTNKGYGRLMHQWLLKPNCGYFSLHYYDIHDQIRSSFKEKYVLGIILMGFIHISCTTTPTRIFWGPFTFPPSWFSPVLHVLPVVFCPRIESCCNSWS